MSKTDTKPAAAPDSSVFKFFFFPEERLLKVYPFSVWCVGWMAIMKSIIWIFTDPNGPDPVLMTFGWKYLVLTLPLFLTGTGVLNKKKWAILGLIAICISEIVFFIVYPQSLTILVLDDLTQITLIFSALLYVINGPISDILILLIIPFMFKYIE